MSWQDSIHENLLMYSKNLWEQNAFPYSDNGEIEKPDMALFGDFPGLLEKCII